MSLFRLLRNLGFYFVLFLPLWPTDSSGARDSGCTAGLLSLLVSTVDPLGAFHKNAWHELIANIAEGRQDWNEAYGPLVRNLPKKLGKELDQQVANLYGQSKTMGGQDAKKALDSYLKWRIPAHAIVEDSVTSGKTAVEAYQAYFDQVRGILGCNRSCYSAQDVLEVAHVLQHRLQEIIKKSGSKLRDKELALFGSFPNGKANLQTSDIDFLTEHGDMKVIFGIHDEQRELSHEINLLLSKKEPVSQLHLAGLTFGDEQFRWVSQANPVVIHITERKIQLWVWPHPSNGGEAAFSNIKPSIFQLSP